MFTKLRRHRQLRKVKTGDGSALKKYRFWQPLSRSLFFIDLETPPAATTDPATFLAGGAGSGHNGAGHDSSGHNGTGNNGPGPDGSGQPGTDQRPGVASQAATEIGRWLGLTAPDPPSAYTPPPAPYVPEDGADEADATSDGAASEAESMPRYIPPTMPAETSAESSANPFAPHPGTTSTYAVDVHYFADEIEGTFSVLSKPSARTPTPPVALYRDGVQIYRSNQPAALPVPGGVIEVATSLYGLTRMHYVPEDGDVEVLRPHPISAEGLRARFGRRFPGVSRAIGVAAILILLVGLVVVTPQTIELITQLDIVAERVGTFTSPIQLPTWANISLTVAGVLAAMERALTLRNHWLIDADTTWASFT